MKAIIHLYHWKEKTFLQIFTIYLRYLIGGAFIIAAIGMGKLSGENHLMESGAQPIQNLQPIQQFFRVMVDSGMYWQFIGWTQIIAGVLLITQRFAKLGSLLFFGMILNIFIITLSYHFQGTPIITGLMLAASVYLLIWDIDYFIILVNNDTIFIPKPLKIADHIYWVYLGFIMIASIVGLALMKKHIVLQLGVPFVEGLLGFILFMLTLKQKTEPVG